LSSHRNLSTCGSNRFPSRWDAATVDKWPGDHPETRMLDILMLVIGLGAFTLLLGYVALCDKI